MKIHHLFILCHFLTTPADSTNTIQFYKYNIDTCSQINLTKPYGFISYAEKMKLQNHTLMWCFTQHRIMSFYQDFLCFYSGVSPTCACPASGEGHSWCFTESCSGIMCQRFLEFKSTFVSVHKYSENVRMILTFKLEIRTSLTMMFYEILLTK